LEAILALLGQGGEPVELEPGIFLSPSFSFQYAIVGEIEEYFDFGGELGSYGVCDCFEQIKSKYADWFNDSEYKFCVSLTEVVKAEQSPDGGWRWHKWGQYIGIKKPQYEYLYDEDDDIQVVYCYHIYQLLD
jgi:hypothetical protein